MKTSESINELATALSKAQGELTNPERNRSVKVATKSGGSYEFKYATLDHIIDMVRPILSKHNLAMMQSATMDDDWVVVTTRLAHSSGQWVEDSLPVKPDGVGPQQCGSAITYARRYALTSLLGLAADEDDDSNLASGNSIEGSKYKKPAGKAKADEIAKQHGMTTGDQIKPPSTAYSRAADKLAAAVRNKDMEEVARIINVAETAKADGKLTENEFNSIYGECTLALKKIKASESEPVAA